MSDELDEECDTVRKLLRDNAGLHTICLEAFTAVTDVHGMIGSSSSLRVAMNYICHKISIPSFEQSEEDSADLYMTGMNFAVFLSTARDYFSAAVKAMDADDPEDLLPDPITHRFTRYITLAYTPRQLRPHARRSAK
jgi:hypothetical protein